MTPTNLFRGKHPIKVCIEITRLLSEMLTHGVEGKKGKMGYVETLKCRTKQLAENENTKVLKQTEKMNYSE